MPEATTCGLAVGSAVLALGWWKWLRSKPDPVVQEHHRGRRLRASEEVDEALSQHRKPDERGLLVGQRVFPSSIATRHLAFIGTTGAGKTLLQRLLMQSAFGTLGQGSGQRALVYDAKQDALPVLAGMNLKCPLLVLNPLDTRSVAWDMAQDIDTPARAWQLASSLVPEAKGDANPFFTNAARQLVYGAVLGLILRVGPRWTFRQLLLLLRDPNRLQALLESSCHTTHLAHFFAHPGTAQNICSTVLTFTTPYETIAACWEHCQSSISLGRWFGEESILVLGSGDENRAAMDTVNGLIFRRLSELALAQDEIRDDASRRTWFFIDEAREAALGAKDSALSRLLTKGRSKGVAVVLGLQDVSGFREAYGREVADEIMGQCNTKVILRLNSPETAAWAAKLFGTREVLERRHGRSKSRRKSLNAEASLGESLSHALVQQPVMLDSQIMGLPDATPQNGISALVISPMTGAFEERIDGAWLSKSLHCVDRSTKNFDPRPSEQQYLQPWGAEDDALLGEQPEGLLPHCTRANAGERAWCQ